MALPEAFIEEVRRVANIITLIQESVPLKKTGSSWKGLCPFHEEKTPSFNVRSEPAVFHCFGCGEGGDIFKFVMQRERVGFPEAVESVARRFGVPIPENRFEVTGERKRRQELLAILEAAAEHFRGRFWSPPGTQARDYLKKRNFKKETLERIQAGAALDSWDDLLRTLAGRFDTEQLLAAGLVLARQKGDGHYDRFRDRVVFPILNESGKVVAFGARSLDGSEPKYLNSPETPVYQKGRVLYGLSWARDAIVREGHALLMEGYLDVARAMEHGIGQAIATCGTALTTGHARLLSRFTDRVLVNFDQDKAGQAATQKSCDVLLEQGLEVRVVRLPEGHDPDSYLAEAGTKAYRERLEAAPHYVEWLIERAERRHDTGSPRGKAAFLGALLPSLARIDNAVERMAWLPAIVSRGGLDGAAAELEARRALESRDRTAPTPAVASQAPPRPIRLLPAERWLLALIVRRADGVAEALDELTESELGELASAEALRSARSLALKGKPVTAEALLDAVEAAEVRRVVSELAVSPPPTERVTPLSCVRELQSRVVEQRITEIQKRVRAAGAGALDELLQEQLELRQRLQHLAAQDITHQ